MRWKERRWEEDRRRMGAAVEHDEDHSADHNGVGIQGSKNRSRTSSLSLRFDTGNSRAELEALTLKPSNLGVGVTNLMLWRYRDNSLPCMTENQLGCLVLHEKNARTHYRVLDLLERIPKTLSNFPI